jgi:hypothetical protein
MFVNGIAIATAISVLTERGSLDDWKNVEADIESEIEIGLGFGFEQWLCSTRTTTLLSNAPLGRPTLPGLPTPMHDRTHSHNVLRRLRRLHPRFHFGRY